MFSNQPQGFFLGAQIIPHGEGTDKGQWSKMVLLFLPLREDRRSSFSSLSFFLFFFLYPRTVAWHQKAVPCHQKAVPWRQLLVPGHQLGAAPGAPRTKCVARLVRAFQGSQRARQEPRQQPCCRTQGCCKAGQKSVLLLSRGIAPIGWGYPRASVLASAAAWPRAWSTAAAQGRRWSARVPEDRHRHPGRRRCGSGAG